MLFLLCWGHCYQNLICEAGRGKEPWSSPQFLFCALPAPPAVLIIAAFQKRCFDGRGRGYCAVVRTSHRSHPRKGEVVGKKKREGPWEPQPLTGIALVTKAVSTGGSLFTNVLTALWVGLQMAAIWYGTAVRTVTGVSPGLHFSASTAAPVPCACAGCRNQSWPRCVCGSVALLLLAKYTFGGCCG